MVALVAVSRNQMSLDEAGSEPSHRRRRGSFETGIGSDRRARTGVGQLLDLASSQWTGHGGNLCPFGEKERLLDPLEVDGGISTVIGTERASGGCGAPSGISSIPGVPGGT